MLRQSHVASEHLNPALSRMGACPVPNVSSLVPARELLAPLGALKHRTEGGRSRRKCPSGWLW